ncbi:hydrolase TatD [Motiliproteus coralliicola]|uniref:Hydrolase TatD n=1 Tax=Motiliproteus coralliicola TaxID=2283196 RepID=A0A369WT37_9GAMM|nr:TatD family hydrolase [Motiliproteus coralliicola]RDE24313.1 hydrolase TatD [Motiliproteus coralliicola]
MAFSNAPLTDIAVNLTDKSFQADLDQVLERSAAAGVTEIIVTGSTLDESRQAVELCQQHPQMLFSTAGVHPHYSRDFDADSLEQLRQLSQQECVKAVGETGLDFNRDFSPRPDQIRAFEQQLELACELKMPVLMHERDAHDRFIEIVGHYRDSLDKALLHCFTGDKEQLYRLLDLDLHIGVTGWLCDERRGAHLPPLLKEIPTNRLMLETDAPYLLPRDLRPKPKSRRNEPCHLAHIGRVAAQHMGISFEQLAQQTRRTSLEFFNIQPSH